MTPPNRRAAPDAVPAAALFAAVAGALALRAAYFDGLTAALAALLLLAWGVERRRARGRWAGPIPPRALALAGVTAGWCVFLLDPPALAPWRALILGAAGLPLWLGFAAPPVPSPPEEDG